MNVGQTDSESVPTIGGIVNRHLDTAHGISLSRSPFPCRRRRLLAEAKFGQVVACRVLHSIGVSVKTSATQGLVCFVLVVCALLVRGRFGVLGHARYNGGPSIVCHCGWVHRSPWT